MIKIVIFTFSLMLMFSRGMDQHYYYVTLVKGDVYRKDGAQIVEGMKILFNEKVTFKSSEGLLILLSDKERFIVSPSLDGRTSKLEKLIGESLHIHAKNIRLSSRGESEVDIRDYFRVNIKYNDKILIPDSILRLPVNVGEFSHIDNIENFFFLQLTNKNGKVFNHLLSVVNNSLEIGSADFMLDGKLFSGEDGMITLRFVRNRSSENPDQFVCKFTPYFISMEKMQSIIGAVRHGMQGQEETSIIDEIYTELYLLYGKPDRSLIRQLYRITPK